MTGEKALLSYNVSKGPELSNPMDPNSAPTDNTCFVLTRSMKAKLVLSITLSREMRIGETVQAFVKWLEKCKITLVPASFHL